ncbi:unnamed protein product [Periconia digitata]|uniref:Uncharacterized protein n=1 Tax=Periconia digitata TaxID=1303443 RepID=A0A9W4UI70_9PLEO|nr:unnamed protein product [Periconia digitata]
MITMNQESLSHASTRRAEAACYKQLKYAGFAILQFCGLACTSDKHKLMYHTPKGRLKK